MASRSGLPVLLGFWAGTAGSICAGLIAFGLAVFDPARPMIQCVTVGLLVSGVLTTVRAGYPLAAFGLAAVFALVKLGGAKTLGLGPASQSAITGAVLGFGVVLIGLIYDLLARSRIRFGKFLIVGPLLAGVYIAISPMSYFAATGYSDLTSQWIFDGFLGLLIGDGAAFGVEISELITSPAPAPTSETPDAPPAPGPGATTGEGSA